MKKDKELSKESPLEEDLDIFDELEKPSEEELKLEKEDAKASHSLDDLEEPVKESSLPKESAEVEQEVKESAEKNPDDDIFADEDPIKEEPLDEQEPETKSFTSEMAALSPDVPVNIVAVMGKLTTDLGKVMEYEIGNVIDLNRPPNETVDLVANGRLIARGELVDIDGKLGVKIVKIVK